MRLPSLPPKALPTLFTTMLMLMVSMLQFKDGELHFTVAIIEVILLKSLFWGVIGMCIAKYKWPRRIFLLILLLFMELKLFLQLRFHCGISPTALTLMLQTNTGEAGEFLQHYFSAGILALMIVIPIAIAVLYKSMLRAFARSRNFQMPATGRILTVALLTILALASLFLNTISYGDVAKKTYSWIPYTGHFNKAIYENHLPVVELIQSYKTIAHDAGCIRNIVAANESVVIDSCTFASPKIVLVIGESHIKSHSSIYGYPLETNPCLTAEKDNGRLIVFENAVTHSAHTGDALKYMFSTCPSSQPGKWETSPLFPAVFRKAGYRVTYHDNQCTRTNEPTVYDYSYAFMFNDAKCEAQCFDYRNTRLYEYDMDMIEHEFSTFDNDSTQHTLDIFHLYGQHLLASNRYPNTPEYLHFKAEDYDSKRWNKKMREQRAHYDNATRYNDLVLKTIIDHYRLQDAIILYLSDHGECIYDDDELTYGRTLNATADTPQHKALFYDIPFFVWVSDTYITRHPETVCRLREATQKRFTHDDLCHTLFLLAGIHSNVCERKRSVMAKD